MSVCAIAGATTINFEQYSQGTVITNQYQSLGVTFTNATELVVPGYNYPGYPPHSGSGVVENAPGADLTATFSTPQTTVTGYETNATGLTIDA